MITIPSSSSWLSSIGAACNISYVYREHGIKIAYVIGMIALFLETQRVTCTPTKNRYENGTLDKEYISLYDSLLSNVDQNTNYVRDEYSNQMFSDDNPNTLDHYSLGDGYEIDIENDKERIRPNNLDKSTTPNPIPTGCLEPGCPLPLMSDAAFSLITMIYVTIAFLFVFFAFCWNNHYPKGNPKNTQRSKRNPSCPLMGNEAKLNAFTTEEVNIKEIANMNDLIDKLNDQKNQKLDR